MRKKRESPSEPTFELSFSEPPAEVSLTVYGEAAAPRVSSAWVLTIVGSLFAVFVLLITGFFFVLS